MNKQQKNKLCAQTGKPLPFESDRRKLLAFLAISSVAVVSLPARWTRPIVDAVILPVHAQTSMCTVDLTVGGPLIGNAAAPDAANCQEACDAEAAARDAQVCAVTETVDENNATQCTCDLDLP